MTDSFEQISAHNEELDAKNSAAVVELIREAKTRGAAIVGIFHDEAVRNDVDRKSVV